MYRRSQVIKFHKLKIPQWNNIENNYKCKLETISRPSRSPYTAYT